MATYDWIVGISLVFGLSLLLNFMTFKRFDTFILWMTVFDGFMVWAGMLELWTLILLIIFDIVIIYYRQSLEVF